MPSVVDDLAGGVEDVGLPGAAGASESGGGRYGGAGLGLAVVSRILTQMGGAVDRFDVKPA
ncbi:MAG: hypothetical protein IPK80_28500 [Nannocystis sp.]|nr:hypothetical protein [Nannocystis sp.]